MDKQGHPICGCIIRIAVGEMNQWCLKFNYKPNNLLQFVTHKEILEFWTNASESSKNKNG